MLVWRRSTIVVAPNSSIAIVCRCRNQELLRYVGRYIEGWKRPPKIRQEIKKIPRRDVAILVEVTPPRISICLIQCVKQSF